MEKKFYKIGIVTKLPNETAEKGDDPQDPLDLDANDQDSGKTDMETKQGGNSSKKENNGPQSSSKGTALESSNTSSTKHKKTNNNPSVSLLSPEISMSDAVPSHLENARKDILAWLSADNPNEDRCYNLLREMELVNEDGYYNYDQECVPEHKQDELQAESKEDPPTHDVSVPVIPQKCPTWGPIQAERQSVRM
jgi:hypothetical protein